ncbi:MAG: SDR family oxidoreductase [Longimicrobiales bacterium]|nr:SDR family oxidoreductase [Longimicrobiales bacterium]
MSDAEGHAGSEGAPGGVLDGALALVAGATRGIGAASARLLADAGAELVLLARTEADLEAMADEIGGRVLPADLSRPESVDAAVGDLLDDGAVPDLVVNAAGVFDLEPASGVSRKSLDRNLDVNLRGAILLVRALLPSMLVRGSGLIVSVGSVAGRKAFPGNAAYSASKYGLRGFHEVLLEELRGTGVRATLLEPAAVDTEIWDPLAPDERDDLPSREQMLRPEDVAEAVLFACTRPPGVQIPFLPVEKA